MCDQGISSTCASGLNFISKYITLEFRLEAITMFDVRNWERFRFSIDREHEQVINHQLCLKIVYFLMLMSTEQENSSEIPPGFSQIVNCKKN